MVYELLAEGFEELEAAAPVDLLRRAGVEIKTVAIGQDRAVTGARGIPFLADLLPDQLNESEMELLILPGGYPGFENLKNNEWVCALLKRAAEKEIPIAAICGAPSVLGALDLLKGRKATCYPGMEDTLGCRALFDAVVEDGPFITSRGAGTAIDFALALVARLVSPEKAEELRKGIVA